MSEGRVIPKGELRAVLRTTLVLDLYGRELMSDGAYASYSVGERRAGYVTSVEIDVDRDGRVSGFTRALVTDMVEKALADLEATIAADPIPAIYPFGVNVPPVDKS